MHKGIQTLMHIVYAVRLPFLRISTSGAMFYKFFCITNFVSFSFVLYQFYSYFGNCKLSNDKCFLQQRNFKLIPKYGLINLGTFVNPQSLNYYFHCFSIPVEGCGTFCQIWVTEIARVLFTQKNCILGGKFM